MKPGKLRKRVEIYRTVEVSDGGGGVTNTDRLIGWTWCSIEPAGAYLQNVAQARQQRITHLVGMRYRTDLSTETWIKYQGRVFDIVGIENVQERNAELKITALERAP